MFLLKRFQRMDHSILYLFQHILSGWPFALSMMGILFAHEMGHYIMCRYYKVPATLPFFIPAPLHQSIGNAWERSLPCAAFQRISACLFDVGVAGPLAGLVIAIPVLFIGLSLSHLGPIEPAAGRDAPVCWKAIHCSICFPSMWFLENYCLNLSA